MILKRNSILIMIMFLYGKTIGQSVEQNVHAAVITNIFPLYVSDTTTPKSMYVKDYLPQLGEVYFYDTLILYRIYNTVNSMEIKGTETKEQQKMEFYSIGFSEKSRLAYLYDSSMVENGKLVSKDSMLSLLPVLTLNGANGLNTAKFSLISSKIEGDSTLNEKHAIVSKTDPDLKGEITLVYKEGVLKGIPYSIAKELDLKKDRRLVKIHGVIYGRYMKEHDFSIGDTDIEIEITDMKLGLNKERLREDFEYVRNVLRE